MRKVQVVQMRHFEEARWCAEMQTHRELMREAGRDVKSCGDRYGGTANNFAGISLKYLLWETPHGPPSFVTWICTLEGLGLRALWDEL
jgi:hypothetical protein